MSDSSTIMVPNILEILKHIYSWESLYNTKTQSTIELWGCSESHTKDMGYLPYEDDFETLLITGILYGESRNVSLTLTDSAGLLLNL